MFNFKSQLLDYPSSKAIRHFMVLSDLVTHYDDGQPIDDSESTYALHYFMKDFFVKKNKNVVEDIEKNHYRKIQDYYTLFTLFEKTTIPITTYGFSFDDSNTSELGIECCAIEKPPKTPLTSFGLDSSSSKNKPSDKYDDEADRLIKLYIRDIAIDFLNDDTSRFLAISTQEGFDWILRLFECFLDGTMWMNSGLMERADSAVDMYLTDFRENLVMGLRNYKKTSYYASLFKPKEKLQVERFVEDVNYISSIKLSNGVNIIPAPQTVHEAIEMRKSPHLKSFRNVLSEWSECLDKGEFKLAAKMMKDIEKANQSLSKLSRYKQMNESPYVQIATFVGGFIPVIGEILHVVAFGSYLVEKSIEHKCEWVFKPSVQSIFDEKSKG